MSNGEMFHYYIKNYDIGPGSSPAVTVTVWAINYIATEEHMYKCQNQYTCNTRTVLQIIFGKKLFS